MSEFVREVRRNAALFTAGLLLVGCVSKTTQEEGPDLLSTVPAVERCNDTPFNASIDPEFTELGRPDKPPDSPPKDLRRLTVPVNAQGEVQNDPKSLTPKARKHVVGAIVQITHNDEAIGSAYLTEHDGLLFAVTAAHVAGDKYLRDLQVIDNKKRISGVAAGCFISEEHGELLPAVPKQELIPSERDVAVLQLTKRIGNSTLTLSDTPATRGEWVRFANFQYGHEPGNPAIFNGLVAAGPPKYAYNVITGIQPWRYGKEGIEEYAQLQMASGGAMLNQDNEALGIVSAGSNIVYDNDDLSREYGIRFTGYPISRDSGLAPLPCWLIDNTSVRLALDTIS